MKQHSVGLASLLLLTFLCNYIECGIIIKRQIIEDPSLNPEIQVRINDLLNFLISFH